MALTRPEGCPASAGRSQITATSTAAMTLTSRATVEDFVSH